MKFDLIALGQQLCEVVRCIPRRSFYLVDNAPESYAELRSVVSVSLPILAPFSSRSVFRDPNGNREQRALHDTVHLYLEADTSVEGESRVAIEQCRLFGHYSTVLADVMYADLVGQTAYFGIHGQFPLDQVGFTLAYLKTSDTIKGW